MENTYQLRNRIYNKLIHREIKYPDLRDEISDNSTLLDIDLSKTVIFYKGYKLIHSEKEKYISIGVFDSNNLREISFDYSRLSKLLNLI